MLQQSPGSDTGCQIRGCEFESHLANILSAVWQKSLRQASFVFHQWTNSLHGKAASCLESVLCRVLVWENQDMMLNPNQSINLRCYKTQFCLERLNIILVLCPIPTYNKSAADIFKNIYLANIGKISINLSMNIFTLYKRDIYSTLFTMFCQSCLLQVCCMWEGVIILWSKVFPFPDKCIDAFYMLL